MSKRKPASQEEIKYILTMYKDKTDAELAADLQGSVAWIRKIRKQYGISKVITEEQKEAGVTNAVIRGKLELGDKTLIDDIANDRIKDDDLKTLFESLFKNTMQYKILEDIYTKDEVKYYLEEFSTHITEIKKLGETINAAELRDLDNLIQTRIRMNRLVKEEKEARDRLIELASVFSSTEISSEEKTLFIMEKGSLEEKCNKISREWRELNTQALSIAKTLDVTRQERVKRMNDSENGVLKIIRTMQDKTKRERLEKQASMLKFSANKVQKEWENLGFLIDGANQEEKK